MTENNSVPGWFPELLEQVQSRLVGLRESHHDERPTLEHELSQLSVSERGWLQSLGNPDLAPAVRTAIEAQLGAATERKQEIDGLLSEEQSHQQQMDNLADPQQVLERLGRLADVLASNNPTIGNLELSLHIDRINCSCDGTVKMRTCKLGTVTEAIDLVSESSSASDPAPTASDSENGKARPRPRRRGRLRTEDSNHDGVDMRALANFAADPERFAGLDPQWFWEDTFHIPDSPPSWAAQHAEAVFRRRQEAKLSFANLGEEFGVTAPTARAAVNHYLSTHPGAKDEVRLRPGGKRPPKFDVSLMGTEARALWEDGWSKLQLAEKYGCSTPTIDKALAFAYAQNGLPMPTDRRRRFNTVTEMRRMLEEGCSLDDIANAAKVSTATARQYLRASLASEGKPMPDLRRRGRRSA